MFTDDSVATLVLRVVPNGIREQVAWQRGPWPLTMDDIVTTQAIRTTYFHRRAAAALYGCELRPTRWWRVPPPGTTYRGAEVQAIEYVWNDHVRGAGLLSSSAYLLIHVALGPDVDRELGKLALLGGVDFDEHETYVRDLSEGMCELAPEIRIFRQRPTTVCYARFAESDSAGPYEMSIDATPRSQWLFTLASATSPTHFHPDPDEPLPAETVLSRSWRAMVLRDGAAFIGRAGRDPFLDNGIAQALVQSVYVDAILLGRMQLDALSGLAEAIAIVRTDDSAAAVAELRKIQYWLDDIRTNLWWDRITHHGPANAILAGFQAQHRTQELLHEVIAKLADRVRFHGVLQDDVTNRLLKLIAVIGFPIGVGLSVAQIVTSAGLLPAAASLLLSAVFAVFISLILQRRFATTRRASTT